MSTLMRCKMMDTEEGLTVVLQLKSNMRTAFNGNDPKNPMPVWTFGTLTEKQNGPWANVRDLAKHVMATGGSMAEHQQRTYKDLHDPSECAGLGVALFKEAVDLYNAGTKNQWVEGQR